MVSGHVGNGSAFEQAITEFAMAYADRTEKDWNSLLAAIKEGRIVAAAPHPKAASPTGSARSRPLGKQVGLQSSALAGRQDMACDINMRCYRIIRPVLPPSCDRCCLSSDGFRRTDAHG
jgi:hypothetical protein